MTLKEQRERDYTIRQNKLRKLKDLQHEEHLYKVAMRNGSYRGLLGSQQTQIDRLKRELFG